MADDWERTFSDSETEAIEAAIRDPLRSTDPDGKSLGGREAETKKKRLRLMIATKT